MESTIKIIIDQNKCTGCGDCATDCTRHTLEMRDSKARVLDGDCLLCGHCLAVCPAGAVRMEGIGDEILEADDAAWRLDADALKAHLKMRRSIRQYKQIPVEREKIEAIIEAGRLTPTGSNMQNVRYIVLQSGLDALEGEILAQYESSGDEFPIIRRYTPEPGFLFRGAPAVILVVSENSTNACLAAMSMELMAEALGLGTLYVGLFTYPANRNQALRRALGIAEHENIEICLTVGYSAVTYLRSAPKKPANIIWR